MNSGQFADGSSGKYSEPSIQDAGQLSLLDLFCMEVNTQIAVFNHELLNLEMSDNPEKSLQALMRSAHSIKGAARIVQVEVGVEIAHYLEDYFVAAQAGKIVPDTNHVDVLLQGGDLLLGIAQAMEAKQSPVSLMDGEVQAYLKNLQALLTPPLLTQPIATIEPVSKLISEPVSEPALEIVEPLAVTPPAVTPLAVTPPAVTPSGELPVTPASATVEQRTVRLSADHLHRLMDLAGETLVTANDLQYFSDAFLRLKTQQVELTRMLEQIKGTISQQQTQAGSQNTSQNSSVALQEKLTLACQRANQCQQTILDRQSEFETFSQKTNHLADRLYREVVASQMRPFSDITQGFPRMVRDVAKKLGKQVRLTISGQATLIDRDILDRLETPLTHLISNAIDHGIEPAEQRQLLGKPAQGALHLEASHRGGVLFISLRDDGRGIDPESLRRSVVQKQLTTPEMAAQMSHAELLEFLYLPGFSTATNLTEISGRGVGLDIVRNMLQSVGGTLRTTTHPGQDCMFHLQLPLTLSVMRTLLIQIAGDPYAVPLPRIDRIIQVNAEQIIFSEKHPYILQNHESVGLIAAADVLGLSIEEQQPPQKRTVIVINDRDNHYGLIIDRVIGEQSLVVRALDQRLGKVPNVSAAALLNDGTPLLILDVDDLLRSIEKKLANGSIGEINYDIAKSAVVIQKRILVVDDSITVREMERKLLENAGYQVDVAVDGMDGWNAARMGQYDLIVTDVDMPRLSGIELVQQIKAHSTLQMIPMIIISYKDREVDRLQGLEAGADYYLTKSSFHDDTLLKAVIDLIGE